MSHSVIVFKENCKYFKFDFFFFSFFPFFYKEVFEKKFPFVPLLNFVGIH